MQGVILRGLEGAGYQWTHGAPVHVLGKARDVWLYNAGGQRFALIAFTAADRLWFLGLTSDEHRFAGDLREFLHAVASLRLEHQARL
jgi:hypothetical protein